MLTLKRLSFDDTTHLSRRFAQWMGIPSAGPSSRIELIANIGSLNRMSRSERWGERSMAEAECTGKAAMDDTFGKRMSAMQEYVRAGFLPVTLSRYTHPPYTCEWIEWIKRMKWIELIPIFHAAIGLPHRVQTTRRLWPLSGGFTTIISPPQRGESSTRDVLCGPCGITTQGTSNRQTCQLTALLADNINTPYSTSQTSTTRPAAWTLRSRYVHVQRPTSDVHGLDCSQLNRPARA